MNEFHLRDTEAARNLDTFTRAYIEAAFFTWHVEDDPLGVHESCLRVEDIHPYSLEIVKRECAEFQSRYGAAFRSREDEAGHDFWFTRNGHGVGFWDGDWPEDDGAALTWASYREGERDFYRGEDGLIHYTAG